MTDPAADPDGAAKHTPETRRDAADGSAVYVTAGLLEVLVGFARDAEPRDVSVALVATPAGDLDPIGGGTDGDSAAETADLARETPVFTDFYLPDAGAAVTAVFGVDLAVPPGRTHGRFLSHATGGLEVSLTDDLAARLIVAVPPWDRETVAAFDRRGRERPLRVLDAAPPEREPPG